LNEQIKTTNRLCEWNTVWALSFLGVAVIRDEISKFGVFI
jgi:hypothetical protein